MARLHAKRKSSEMDGNAIISPSPTTKGRTGNALTQDLTAFCRKAGLQLSERDIVSPAKYDRTDIKQRFRRRYQHLWWEDLPALRRIELAFPGAAAGLINEFERIKVFLRLSEEPAKDAATPQHGRFRDAIVESEAEQSTNQRLSDSPTRSIKNVRNYFKVSKTTTSEPPQSPEKPPPIPWGTKPTPPSSQTRDIGAPLSTSTSFATNANTSFATTVANTSFWSNAGPSGSQETASSSFSDDGGPPKRDSNLLSSLSTNEAAEIQAWAQNAESSQRSDETVKPCIPHSSAPLFAKPASTRESQSTYYGSSLDPKEIDQLMAMNKENVRSEHHHHRYTAQIQEDVFMADAIVDDRQPWHTRAPESSCQTLPPMSATGQAAHPHRDSSPTKTSIFSSPTKSRKRFASLRSPPYFDRLPFAVRWEAQRVLQTGVIADADLDLQWQHPRSLCGLYDILARSGVDFRRGFDANVPPSFDGLTLGARLEWSKTKSEPFQIVLDKPKKDISCSLQRYVGADHLLFMEVPNLQKPPKSYEGKDISVLFMEFYSQPQKFLGRRWVCIFLQPNKKKGVRNTLRAIWLADSDRISVVQALQWLLPLAKNGHQPACKAYMRIELLLSRTIPVARLLPHEIAYGVKDQTATPDPDDRRFERPDCHHRFFEEHDPKIVMNDGCSKASIWLFNEYRKLKGLSTLPSALQFRFAGGKGVLFLEDEDPRKLNERPRGTLLELTDSQIKVLKDLLSADDEWLTLNIVKQNGAPKPSVLYTAFLPILIKGGVSGDDIRNEVREQVRTDTQEFLQALDAPETLALRRWMQSQNSVREMKARDSGIQSIGGFPVSREERIIQMLQSGFHPKKCKFLANEVKLMARSAFDLKSKHFQIRLAQSTTLMGIADPEGCLEPGEVHVQFEKAFLDPVTGRSIMVLDGMEGLVARNPALGAWDIQKIRFVYKHELARFKNLVVFPKKGMRPLAGKLQGGDYDGDTFWITWSKRLTEPFMNTPAPWAPPRPEELGITVDRTRLSDLVQDSSSEEQWLRFLSQMHNGRMQHSAGAMLGIVTLELEKLNYLQGDIDTKEARAMIPVHDYMADADKQGYRYSMPAFRAWMRSMKIPTNNPEPRYWEFTRHEHEPKMSEKEKKEREQVMYPANQVSVDGNITDSVYFDVVAPLIEEALKQATKKLEDVGMYDDDLSQFYKTTLNTCPEGSPIWTELKSLEKKLKTVRDYWSANVHTDGEWTAVVKGLRTFYNDILPDDLTQPTVVEWLRRQGYGFSTWDLLKASALGMFQFFGNRRPGQMMFLAAGRELCYLKLMQLDPNARFMLESHYAAHKMRPAPKVERAVDEYESDGVDAGEEEGDDDDNEDIGGYY